MWIIKNLNNWVDFININDTREQRVIRQNKLCFKVFSLKIRELSWGFTYYNSLLVEYKYKDAFSEGNRTNAKKVVLKCILETFEKWCKRIPDI